MQKKTIHLTIGTVATICALPLAFVGLRGLWRTDSPVIAPKSSPLARAGVDDPVEIHLASGTGADINKALRRLPLRGGKVILAAGVFETLEPILLSKDNVELRGSGPLTIIRLRDQAACPVVVLGEIATPVPRVVSNLRLTNLVIDGNRSAQGPDSWGGISDTGQVSMLKNNALTIRGVADAQIEGVITRNARFAGVVLEKGCRQVHIDNLESFDNQFDGLACSETEESTFSRLKLHSNQAAGLSLDTEFNHNTVKSAVITGNGSQGIFMRHANNNDFKTLEIKENGAHGIFIAQAANAESRCTFNLFSDITVLDNRGMGLRVNDDSCTENTVLNSKFKGNKPANLSQSKEALVALIKVEGF